MTIDRTCPAQHKRGDELVGEGREEKDGLVCILGFWHFILKIMYPKTKT